jgi:hypothetical protein
LVLRGLQGDFSVIHGMQLKFYYFLIVKFTIKGLTDDLIAPLIRASHACNMGFLRGVAMRFLSCLRVATKILLPALLYRYVIRASHVGTEKKGAEIFNLYLVRCHLKENKLNSKSTEN